MDLQAKTLGHARRGGSGRIGCRTLKYRFRAAYLNCSTFRRKVLGHIAKFLDESNAVACQPRLIGVALLAAAALMACASRHEKIPLSPEDQAIQYKFRGVNGVVLYLDASGYGKEKITMYNEKGEIWQALFGVSTGAQQSTYPSTLYLPKTLRVIWRSNDATQKMRYTMTGIPCHKLANGEIECPNPCRIGCPDYSRLGWEGGTILGDYTVPLATRIPDKVLDDIRANGGALRVKIRLKDNGVAIGWDVERSLPIPNLPKNYVGAKYAIDYFIPGGDFREAQVFNGKVTDPGWEK